MGELEATLDGLKRQKADLEEDNRNKQREIEKGKEHDAMWSRHTGNPCFHCDNITSSIHENVYKINACTWEIYKIENKIKDEIIKRRLALMMHYHPSFQNDSVDRYTIQHLPLETMKHILQI